MALLKIKPFIIDDITTSNVIEGANLYYTNARVYANVIGLIPDVALKANVADLNTSNVVEGANLYYTNARVYANVIGLIPNITGKANVADLNTSNVVEGANLYFTNTRAVGALTAGQNIVIASNGLILSTASGGGGGNYDNTNAYSNLLVALPNYTGNLQAGNANVLGTLFTGNIISATGIGGQITGANLISSNIITANTWTNLYASNVIESGNTLTGNVFFTNARAVAALTAGQNIVIASNGLILSTASGGGGNYDNTNAYANVIVLLPNYSGNLKAGNANITGALSVTSTLTAGNVVSGMGSGGSLTGANIISTNYANVNNILLGNIIVANSITSTYLGDGSALTNLKPNIHMTVALSDETTSITTGLAKITFRAPYAMTLTQIPRASLSTASTSGNPTVDIDKNGVSIFSTLLSIDANEKTSTTAATPAVLSTTTFADDDEITMDISTAGTGAKGLKVTLYYRRT